MTLRTGTAGATAGAPPRSLPTPWQLSAALHVACGLLVAVATPVTPHAPGASEAGVLAVGAAAAVLGIVIWFLPWARWPSWAPLVLVPEALVLVGVYNHHARDPFLFSLFYLVIFVWIGVSQPVGTSLKMAPLAAAGYLATLAFSNHSGLGTASAVYVLPTAVVIGEAVSLVADRLRRADLAHRLSEERYASLVRHATDYIAILDEESSITYASPAVERILGRTPEQLAGARGGDFVHPDEQDAVSEAFRRVRAEPGVQVAVHYRATHADGTWRWVEATFTNLIDDPAVGGIVVNGRDVTERKQAEAELAHNAYHDDLTGLPNRPAFLRDLGHAVEASRRHGTGVAVLYLDLDGFKVINDSLGHAAGDRVLVQVAARLASVVRAEDRLARLGGDEFVVLLERLRHPEDALRVADELIESLTRPLTVRLTEIVVGTSIGVAVSERGNVEAEDLLRRADLALYRAKERGRGRAELFDDDLARQARRRLDLESDLRTAVEQERLFLRFQPEIDLGTGRLVALEALLRWDHPRRGEVAPADFIRVAEDSGLIVPIGCWVLEEACRRAAEWSSDGEGPVMSVNVSVRQLLRTGFADHVGAALDAAGLPAARLRLEITESVMLEPDQALRVLTELRAVGVALAIDDFGTGYSSLAYLKDLPFDAVKIDKGFLDPVLSPDDGAPLVEAVVAMSNSLGLQAIAEGVETPLQLALLRRLGCGRAQGHLFSRPLLPDELGRVLDRDWLPAGNRVAPERRPRRPASRRPVPGPRPRQP